MAKWYGKIGYAESIELSPGEWDEQIIERSYYGDIQANVKNRLQTASGTNDNIVIANTISIIADPYANDHFYAIRYVEFAGTKWKVSNVEVQYPRLILSTGGVYNG